jgi:hypothetical protein
MLPASLLLSLPTWLPSCRQLAAAMRAAAATV